MDTAFGSFLLFEQVESNVTKHRKNFRSLIFADTAAIFIQSDIQNLMQFIFDEPLFRTDCKIHSALLDKLEM